MNNNNNNSSSILLFYFWLYSAEAICKCVPGDKINKVLKMKSRKLSCVFTHFGEQSVQRETKAEVWNKSGSKVFIAVVSYRLAVSERTLPVEIPLNPCSVAADRAVPPGETLPPGIDYWTSCLRGAEATAEVPAAQWPCCLSTQQVSVHADVMAYATQRRLQQQLQLSFPATTGRLKPLPPEFVIILAWSIPKVLSGN